jgi:hypothetical protein
MHAQRRMTRIIEIRDDVEGQGVGICNTNPPIG